MPDVEFGEWLPDQRQVKTPGLLYVNHMSPSMAGWQPLPKRETSEIEALFGEARGVFIGRTQDGEAFFFAATDDKIYQESGSFTWTDRSKVGDYTLGPVDHWEFDVYGDAVYATNKNDPIQRAASPGGTFADISAHAPFAGTIATAKEFLMAGNLEARGNNIGSGAEGEGALHWSAIGDPTDWPTIATADAINKQSDFQILEGDGGPVVQIVDAAEYTAVFRQKQVWRADQVGAPKFWTFRKIDNKRGAVVPNAAIAVGNFVYFLSREGFMIFNGAQTQTIGFEKIDRTVLNEIDWSRADAHCSVAHLPRLHSVVWSIPMTAGDIVFGNYNTLIGYNYDLKQFWHSGESNQRVFAMEPRITDLSMDGATYSSLDMDVALPTGLADQNMDELGAGAGQDIVLSYFNTDNLIRSYSGIGGDWSTIHTGKFELPEGRRGMIRMLRPSYIAEDLSNVAIGAGVLARVQPGGPRTSWSFSEMKPSGVCPQRAVGRYHEGAFVYVGPVRDCVGFDFKAGRLGKK